MNVLYIIRHGDAVPHGTPGMTDDERPLTPEGEERMEEAAKGLKRLGIEPARIVTSPLPRAKRTAEIVARALKCEDRLSEDPALGADRRAEDVRDWVAGQKDEALAIVGHNPWCSDLVGLMVMGSDDAELCELKKGGVAALKSEDGGWRIEWLTTPRILRRMGGA